MLYGFGLPHNPPSNTDFRRTSWRQGTQAVATVIPVCQHLNCSQMLDVWSIDLTKRCRNMLVNYSMEHLGGVLLLLIPKELPLFFNQSFLAKDLQGFTAFSSRTEGSTGEYVVGDGFDHYNIQKNTMNCHESMSCDHFKHHSASFCIWLQVISHKFLKWPHEWLPRSERLEVARHQPRGVGGALEYALFGL